MKKVLKAALALLLTVAITCVAFADGSKTNLVEVSTAVDGNGVAVEITVNPSKIADLTAAEAAEITQEFTEAAATVLTQFDLSVEAGTEFPVTVTFNVEGITSSSNVYVFHHNGTNWHTVPSSVGKNSVTATFDSLSPVAIVLVDENANGSSTTTGSSSSSSSSSSTGSSSSSSSSSTGKSPKTGEGNSVLYAGAAILAAGAAAFVVSKKRA